MGKKVLRFFKSDIVLTISLILAAVSCVMVPPNIQYLEYVDYHTLILLFCLMLIVEGLRREGFFHHIGNLILNRVKRKRGIVFTLVFLCFFSSMFITNDVALITFVPFGLMIFEMSGMTSRTCYTVTLMTIAANLGSMFTPFGNPQNLYLYSLSGLRLYQFLLLMLPYTAVSAVLLILFILAGYRQTPVRIQMYRAKMKDRRLIILYLILFVLCVLTVAGFVPHLITFLAVTAVIFLKNRKLFAGVDYALLLTFVFFFIFVGNLNHFEELRHFISQILKGHEKAVGIAASQVMSNVPAAMLLSNYTRQIPELIVGVNIGGLGTLIASMASLISYKQINNKYPEMKWKYMMVFTLCNLIFLVILCMVRL